jgi:hypothetical protein
MKIIHYRPDGARRHACNKGHMIPVSRTTADRKLVTCKDCLRSGQYQDDTTAAAATREYL